MAMCTLRGWALSATLALAGVVGVTGSAAAQSLVVPLWEDGAPGFEDRRDEPEEAQDWWVRNIHNPSVTVFLPSPETATGAAVVIVPGGGHHNVVFPPEGIAPALYFQEMGVAAFALKYRLAGNDGSPYTVEEHAAEDVRRALRLVRARAEEWGVDPGRVGVMGWSAGGELAALVSYGPPGGEPDAADPIERQSARPDFQISIYPGGRGLPDRLDAPPPPAFFLAANDDLGPARTITRTLELYRLAGVSAEVHLYAQGGHAFNMGDRSDLQSIGGWPQRLAEWMADSGFLDAEDAP